MHTDQEEKHSHQDEKAEKHESAPNINIRQASLGDQVAWKEERSSQEQFGFSIYGHTADDFCCCAVNRLPAAKLRRP